MFVTRRMSVASAAKAILPVIDYEIWKAPEDIPHFVPSRHICFDNHEIEKLGLKPGSTWKDQTAEMERLGGADKIKRVLWVRHGEGLHNAAEREFGKHQWETVEAKKEIYFDPDLNEVGVEQAKRLAKAINPHIHDGGLKVDLIIVSPLARAIRTAELAFADIWERVPVVAVELARERHGKNICDRRRTVTEIKKLFPRVDFSTHMFAEEDMWHTEERETPESVRERAKRLMRWIMDLPFRTIAIVGHSDFMSHAVEIAGFPPHWPANCEMVPMMLTLDDSLKSDNK